MNCAKRRARPAIMEISTSPIHPPAGCQSAANPLRYAFSPPANRLPAPIHDESSVKIRTGQVSLRPATRKSAWFFTPSERTSAVPSSTATMIPNTTL